MVPVPPPGMPAWAVSIFYVTIAVGAALIVLVPSAIAAYVKIRGDISKLRNSNHSIANGVTATTMTAQQNSKILADIHRHIDMNGNSIATVTTHEDDTPPVGNAADITIVRPDQSH